MEDARSIRSVEEIHEATSGGTGKILKLGGSWDGKEEMMKEVSISSDMSCRRDKASAIPLLHPRMCCGCMENDCSIHVFAREVAISYNSGEEVGLELSLWSHPNALELSVSASTWPSGGMWFSWLSMMMPIAAAVNSKTLLEIESEMSCKGNRHAFPVETEKPPIP